MIEWISIPLSDLPIATGNSINPFDFLDEEFELYSVPSHETGKPEVVKGREIGSNKQLVSPGTVLLCKINPRINRTWIVSEAGSRRQIASTEWIPFYGCEEVDPRFLMRFMQQSDVRDYLAANASGVGGSLMRVKPATLKGVNFRMPGIRTQRKIVEKVEELLSDLDAGVAELKAAQRKLAQYRQSLLKAAVEGALTADWRAARSTSSWRKPGSSRSKYQQPQKRDPGLRRDDEGKETGAELLQRILSERRTRWEQKQLAKFAEQGKTPPKGWQAKYPEPVSPNLTDLPSLPEGWVWASLDALIEEGPQNGLYLPGDRYGRGTPILRIDDYQIGWCRARDALNQVEADASTEETYALKQGDILINRVNSVTHLGKCLAVPKSLIGALFESNMMRLRLTDNASPDFVEFYLGSLGGRTRLIKDAKWAVNQASINQQDVRRTPVPLPSHEEQIAIAELLRLHHDAIDVQLAAVDGSIRQAAAQRKNILKAAFSGQLVPQDPNDEPASVLLARIRAEPATKPKRNPRTLRKTRNFK